MYCRYEGEHSQEASGRVQTELRGELGRKQEGETSTWEPREELRNHVAELVQDVRFRMGTRRRAGNCPILSETCPGFFET